MIEKIVCTCLVCSRQFEAYPSKIESGRGKYCSRECTRLARLGKAAWNKDLRYSFLWAKGRKKEKKIIDYSGREKNFRGNIRRIGEDNKNWKGDNVSYRSLHRWVEQWRGKPNKCELCGKTNLRLHWASVDHKYERNLVKWLRLCAPCHGKYDKIHNLRKRI